MSVEDITLQEGMQAQEVQDDILYLLLSQSPLKQALRAGGEIRKGKRPDRKEFAKQEDCTIGSLSSGAASVQLGTSNVNIYIPDRPSVATGSNAQGYEKDTERIKEIKAIAYPVLKKYYCERGWSFECVEQGTLEEADLHCHRVWFKIRFVFHN